MTTSAARRGYLDWLRGVAVLVMIEAHLLDSWTRFPDRQTRQFAYAMIVGGFGAPLFLFLAGVAVPLSAAAKLRRTGDLRAATRGVAKRGLEVFGLAFLFRAQSWILSWARARDLLKVDILNIMGPSIVVAAWMWGAVRSQRGRIALFSAAAVITSLAAPGVRALPGLWLLPDPLEAYIRPVAGLSHFVFFPWMGFVFAGAVVGLILEATRDLKAERRANMFFALAGLALAFGAYRASFLPSPLPNSRFWTTSPTFFFLRVGVLTAAVAAAYLWESRPAAVEKFSPLRQLGKTSLFIYWIHVEMIYGVMSLGLHKSLSWTQVWIVWALFCAFMLLCSLAKDRFVSWWNGTPVSFDTEVRRMTS
jgi:uncharacterized membrane protein